MGAKCGARIEKIDSNDRARKKNESVTIDPTIEIAGRRFSRERHPRPRAEKSNV